MSKLRLSGLIVYLLWNGRDQSLRTEKRLVASGYHAPNVIYAE
jgi:hypothetical protein